MHRNFKPEKFRETPKQEFKKIGDPRKIDWKRVPYTELYPLVLRLSQVLPKVRPPLTMPPELYVIELSKDTVNKKLQPTHALLSGILYTLVEEVRHEAEEETYIRTQCHRVIWTNSSAISHYFAPGGRTVETQWDDSLWALWCKLKELARKYEDKNGGRHLLIEKKFKQNEKRSQKKYERFTTFVESLGAE